MPKVTDAGVEVDLATLKPFPGNAKTHDDALLQESITDLGQYRPLVVARSDDPDWDGVILAGNGTADALHATGARVVLVTYVEGDEKKFRKINLVDNRANDRGDYDRDLLLDLLQNDLVAADLTATGYTQQDIDDLLAASGGSGDTADALSLADRFLLPPFTVLDARSGAWQDRKRKWLSQGIRSDEGRDGQLLMGDTNLRDPDFYRKKTEYEARIGRAVTAAEFAASGEHIPPATMSASMASGTSTFDPVLCEIAVLWYSPPGGHVVDPWAGGSVRGLVSTILGRTYTGVELRPEQVAANVAQSDAYTAEHPALAVRPTWIVGDTADELPALAGTADMILGCPPYFDLEKYSADPKDLSNLSERDFLDSYARHLQLAYDALKPDRYMFLVVGSARDKKGRLRDLRSETVRAAEAAGFILHNDGVLLTAIGSAATMAARNFRTSRAMTRVHQDILVFVKGSRKAASQACGDVELDTATNWGDPADDEL